ncbi:uncharacterized protein LOC116771718 [Danaus plexippus]|uniref:A-kinase anchor protein 14 n=1 Tax=Danaus plexippus plexippus TaxID=278856 RepID=A0A212FAY2_DANPL|nr:uncharacterized protein LOC116771718 [Danaus plexippus]OWR50891.1 A-kinase anchor protein 14 [Danaus plexippus plexippus]
MDIPQIKSYEEQAIDTVVSVLNRAKESLGERQTLKQLATSRDYLTPPGKVILTSLGCPLAVTSEKLINKTIQKKWRLTDTFMYVLHYMGSSKDECSQYYYFEAVFSQPTASYPIPQATATVFFRVEDKHVEPPEIKGVPTMTFRLEGHRTDHDVRQVLLIPDWILGIMKMKIKFFQRLEELTLF